MSLSTATVTKVDASLTVVTLAAAKPTRRSLTIYNDATTSLYLKLGATATTDDYTVKILAGAYYELPAIVDHITTPTSHHITTCYQGVLTGLWITTATGSARVTEV